MSWPLWVREKVRNFVTAASGGPWPQMKDQAARLLEELPAETPARPLGRSAAARPERARSGGVDKSGLPFAPPSFPGKRERKAERNDRMRTLRIRVLRRGAGRCEFRCVVLGEPTDVHHLFGGADRRELESEYTLAAICEDCHDKCNASPAWAREQGLAFARRMAAAAQARGDAAALAGFTETVQLLEARIQLAAVQARPAIPNTTEET
jgi:hypothetical protein